MAKIKQWFQTIGKKLKGFPKGRQGKAFSRILQFFALMVVLTIFARGAAGVTMPEVTVAALSQQTIRNATDYSGTITATNKQDVKLPAGLTIQKINVASGSVVKEGDELVTFDTATVQQSLTEQRIALQDLKLQLAELQKSLNQDSAALDAAKSSQAAAQSAYDYAQTAGNQRLAAAQTEVNNQIANLTTAQDAKKTAEDYFNSLATPWGTTPPDKNDPLYPEYQKWLEAQAAKDSAIAALSQAQTAKDTAEAALATAQIDVPKDIAAAKKTLDDANAALSAAQKAYDEAKPAFNLEAQKRQLEISKKKQEISKQEEAVAKLQALAGQNSVITAPVAGTVTNITAAVGAVTADTDYVRISTGAEGYLAEFPVPKDNAKDIKVGNAVSVKQGNYYWGAEARVVGKSMPDETGMITVRAQLTGTDWADGDAVTVTVVFSDRQYWNCVPVAAVRPEADGYYVLVLYEENTILGTQTVARKVTVTIQDQDKTNAAIDGIYENNARIVVSSTKPVSDGDMVRISEESSK
ncbi:MAG: hypothetical protein ACK5L3_05495 [Oscillospiraceae bacterium]